MTLYKHYKNLPYRLLDIVKHSETQEDLVLYETLYENDNGRLWVRPKEMFFETIEIGGTQRPRFSKSEVEIRIFSCFSDEPREAINQIGRLCFGDWDESQLDLRTAGKKNVRIAVGYYEGKAVAFKIGYELQKQTYYSWLGGVNPSFHRFGFASSLTEDQHIWCIGAGYDLIRTKCLNFNLPMLRLNLKSGFLIIDTELTESGLKLILEKRIRESLV